MKPEEKARQNIDKLLEAAGWTIQDFKDLNLGSSLGVAVCEFPLISGFADYLLFIDRKAVGALEAKPEGTTLTSTEYQSDKYLFSLPKDLPCCQKPLPFAYESTGVETFFRNLKDSDTRSRRVFAFHSPKAFLEWVNQNDTVRKRLQNLPYLTTQGLRDCQVEAIRNLEKSFSSLGEDQL